MRMLSADEKGEADNLTQKTTSPARGGIRGRGWRGRGGFTVVLSTTVVSTIPLTSFMPEKLWQKNEKI